MNHTARLTDRGILAVSGADARSFLQGLVTNDVRNVTPKQAVFSAMLTPQGKFLFEFFILEQEGTLWLETEAARLPALMEKLGKYRLRAQVTFTPLPELRVAAVWESDVTPEGRIAVMRDPRHPMLGWRVLYDKEPPAGTPADYDAHRIALGVPEGGKDLAPERALLLEYGYDRLNAIDFAKGCYVGQEVTARSKHRASLHKGIYQVSAEAMLPPAGTLITSEGREVGIMHTVHAASGLALLRHEAVASGHPLLAGSVELHARLPEWLT